MKKKVIITLIVIALIVLAVGIWKGGWFGLVKPTDCTPCNIKTTDGTDNKGVNFGGKCTGTGNVSDACYKQAYPSASVGRTKACLQSNGSEGCITTKIDNNGVQYSGCGPCGGSSF